MTRDELRGHVSDVLALPLGDGDTIQTLLARVNGADPHQILAAALAVAREQDSKRIAELERALDHGEQERRQLEDELQELRRRIKRRVK